MKLCAYDVSCKKVYNYSLHDNRIFKNCRGAPFEFKFDYDTLVYVCHNDAEECILVRTISSQIMEHTMAPVEFQLECFDCSSKNGECRENEIIKVGCLFNCFER